MIAARPFLDVHDPPPVPHRIADHGRIIECGARGRPLPSIVWRRARGASFGTTTSSPYAISRHRHERNLTRASDFVIVNPIAFGREMALECVAGGRGGDGLPRREVVRTRINTGESSGAVHRIPQLFPST